MLFNSYIFILVFLPITLTIFFGLTKFRLIKLAQFWLLIASLTFYSYWNIAYLPLILISLGCNYTIGDSLHKSEPKSDRAKYWLIVGICLNLLLLGYYKYANFFLTTLDAIAKTNWHLPNLILPLGISFYTFNQIAYLVNTYRGETAKHNILTYSLFATFFSYVTSGPLVRYQEIVPQFSKLRNFIFSQKNISIGLTLFVLGLGKKMLIADNISPWVEQIFSQANKLNFVEAWVGALSYTLQLYFDFSGYSDMAIGIALMFNINLPINFNSPYKATSISDFWRRWHISLSNFLRDYLYIPLGGSRKGEIRRSFNLIITMLLGGLWHGAGWTFVVWGGLHGLYLAINHQWRKLKFSLPSLLAQLITFIAVVISWVLFRAKTLPEGMAIIQTMFGLKGIVLPAQFASFLSWLSPLGFEFKGQKILATFPNLPGTTGTNLAMNLAALIALMIVVFCCPNTMQIVEKFKPNWYFAIAIGLIATVCILSLNKVAGFLYFQF